MNGPTTGDWNGPDGAPAAWDGDPLQQNANSQDSPGEQPLDRESLRPSGLAEWFVISQTVLPAMLYLPGSQAYRLPLRVGAYAISLYAFVVWWFDRGGRHPGRHPAERWLSLVLLCLVLMIAHPNTANLYVGLAQTALYFAIFCPLFWAPAYVQKPRQLVRLLVLLLVCNGINAMVGVLQVYDPAVWMPREFSGTVMNTPGMLEMATYIGRNGQRIVRPPGLFDTPGAVCGPGATAALLGLIFALEPIAWWKRGVSVAFSAAGISAIYLSHVRSSLLVTVGMMAVYVALLAAANQKKRVTVFIGLAVGLVVVGLSVATFLGGESIQERFSTLFEDDPRTLYYQSRGVALENAFDKLLVDYPLGVGLGRWGMMSGYFGDSVAFDSKGFFAEIQPTAWILDGGIFLLLLYAIALVVTMAYEIALTRRLWDTGDRILAAIVVAANFGTVAMVFSFVPFGTAIGMQFWFLEGALHGAMLHQLRRS
jgi:hypothetical protein